MFEAQRDISRLVVVVPVHNEELVLDACLSAVGKAAERTGVDTVVVTVLDSCTDSSASIAGSWAARTGGRVLAIDRRNVGAARAAGFSTAALSTAGFSTVEDAPGTWFATTDADSVVRPDWLTSQLAHARRGAAVVAGTVLPDSVGLDPVLAATYFAGYRIRPGHRHVHGANLGVRADVYWNVGGFAALRTAEDVDIVHRLEQAAYPVLYACDSPVTTSARRVGRAPDGFADHLRTLEAGRSAARQELAVAQ
ncbi:glycosyltransferase [Rhodococcus sp. G-MC3]|uniref:glycosyltransferase n=1 Tax=Rhodococcus sp. G-MC3 TaxID=3046209 RepID=UPI0024BB94D2|nr:glycosyltransferase [Rhodococcus sp. G-MC3]MDJ0394609.1 glycosyltransferase [Rhodococcus sp. G-MC3]